MSRTETVKVPSPEVSLHLAQVVQRQIACEIANGSFGEKLPAEDKLARQLGVSRFTVRSALLNLQQVGLITRKRGIGTRVNTHVPIAALGIYRVLGWDDVLKLAGFRVRVETYWQRSRERFPLAERLGLDTGGAAMVIRRRYFADGELTVALSEVAPWSNMIDQAYTGLVPGSLTELADHCWNLEVASAGLAITPRVAGAEPESEIGMGLPAGSAYTRLDERFFGATGDLVAVSECLILPGKLPVSVLRHR